jgi:hypothetical protein
MNTRGQNFMIHDTVPGLKLNVAARIATNSGSNVLLKVSHPA